MKIASVAMRIVLLLDEVVTQTLVRLVCRV